MIIVIFLNRIEVFSRLPLSRCHVGRQKRKRQVCSKAKEKKKQENTRWGIIINIDRKNNPRKRISLYLVAPELDVAPEHERVPLEARRVVEALEVGRVGDGGLVRAYVERIAGRPEEVGARVVCCHFFFLSFFFLLCNQVYYFFFFSFRRQRKN